MKGFSVRHNFRRSKNCKKRASKSHQVQRLALRKISWKSKTQAKLMLFRSSKIFGDRLSRKSCKKGFNIALSSKTGFEVNFVEIENNRKIMGFQSGKFFGDRLSSKICQKRASKSHQVRKLALRKISRKSKTQAT